jgi:uncharacterized protein (TIGR02246 family)
MSPDSEALMSLATRYAEAWASRDVEAILALHSSDSVFQVHGGAPPATGLDEIRGSVESTFATWGKTRFEHRTALFGGDHWVVEWTFHATGAGKLETPAGAIDVAGKEVSFEGVDVVRVSNGLVTRKDSYIDAAALQAQLA